MQFKIHSSASFPASQLHSLTCRPLSPVPIPYSTAALLAYASCFPLIAFCTSSLCPYWLAFAGRVFIASWQTQVLGHTFNNLWTISIYSGLGFFPFSFTEHCLYFLRTFSTAIQSAAILPTYLLLCFFLSTFSMFSLSCLTKLRWAFLHCCPLCTFALRRVQV